MKHQGEELAKLPRVLLVFPSASLLRLEDLIIVPSFSLVSEDESSMPVLFFHLVRCLVCVSFVHVLTASVTVFSAVVFLADVYIISPSRFPMFPLLPFNQL